MLASDIAGLAAFCLSFNPFLTTSLSAENQAEAEGVQVKAGRLDRKSRL
jgi:hypothetical protein